MSQKSFLDWFPSLLTKLLMMWCILSDKQELMLQLNPHEEQMILRVSVFLCLSRKASLTDVFLFIHAICSFVVKLKHSHFSD
jgi:hypothetical protein